MPLTDRFVALNFQERCIFKDITAFVDDASKPLAKMKLAPWTVVVSALDRSIALARHASQCVSI